MSLYSVIIDVIVSFLLGSMIFFAGIVTPTAFSSLEKNQAQVFLRKIFPRYFLWGIIVSVLALGFCVGHSPKGAVLMTFVLIGFIYARQMLIPKIHAAREHWMESESAEDKMRLDALHKRSVIITVVQMAMLGIIIIA